MNYYWYRWPKRAHTLATLNKSYSNKVMSKWTNVDIDAFMAINKIVGQEYILYLDKSLNSH